MKKKRPQALLFLLSEQLSGELQLHFGREMAVKFLARRLADKVAFRRAVDAGDAVQIAGDQLAAQEWSK